MTREAERVYTDPVAVARLESLIAGLPNGARVALQLEDDGELCGIVAARPILQVFFDAAGDEGSNAVLRLELDPVEGVGPAHVRDLWLDRIVEIRYVGPH